MKTMLVIGAMGSGSLGSLVEEAGAEAGWQVHTAGISGDEKHVLDVTNGHRVAEFFREWCQADPPPEAVVCTAGINVETSVRHGNFTRSIQRHWEVNTLGHMHVLEEWVYWWLTILKQAEGVPAVLPNEAPLHFVAISSNSAQIARSKSAGYCASKAALSMAIRCAGRELADTLLNVYAYEPGWMDGTPMSINVEERLRRSVEVEEDMPPLHRIPGNRTVTPELLATMIVHGMQYVRSPMNGCTIRIDGGEQ